MYLKLWCTGKFVNDTTIDKNVIQITTDAINTSHEIRNKEID